MEQDQYELMHRVESRMWWYRGLHALLVQTLARNLTKPASKRSGPILDAGCGTGGLLVALQGAGLGSWRLGLEVDSHAALLSYRKSAAPVALGSVDALPFRTGSAAAIVSADVLCHARVEPETALAEFARTLAPGGVLVLNLPAYGWLLSAHDRAVHNVRRFTAGQVRLLLSGAGLVGIRTTYWNTFLLPLMIAHRLLSRRRDGMSDVREYATVVDRGFGAVLAFERFLIGLGVRLPFGGSLVAVARKHD